MRYGKAKAFAAGLMLAAMAAWASAPTDGVLLGGTSAASSASDSDLLPVTQGGNIVKQSFTAIWTWIQTKTMPVGSGGTGQTSYTDGQLLIGNSTGNTLSKATLTQGSGVTITNGHGTITIAASGSGGGCTTVGSSGQGLFDDGAGGCTSSSTFTTSTIAALNVNQSFTAGQAITPLASSPCGTQSASGTMTVNFATSNSCLATFGAGDLTIANPSNIKAGQPYIFVLTQDGVGNRHATWGSDFNWANSTPPTLSTGAGAVDVVSCWSSTTSFLLCALTIQTAGH